VIGSDDVQLNDPASGLYAGKDVGSGITVSVSGLSLVGADARDYVLAHAGASAAIGSITPATLTAGLTGAVTKTYDGTTAATLSPDNYTLAGVIGADDVWLNDPTMGSYARAAAGSAIPVTVTGLAILGSDAGDYQLARTTITAAVGAITMPGLTSQQKALPVLSALPQPAPLAGGNALLTVGGGGFAPLPLLIDSSDAYGMRLDDGALVFFLGLPLAVSAEQALAVEWYGQPAIVSLPPAQAVDLGGNF
jgi:hypothetical protein